MRGWRSEEGRLGLLDEGTALSRALRFFVGVQTLRSKTSARCHGRTSHPYEEEITALLENPPVEFDFVTGSFDLEMSSSLVWIEAEPQLKELVKVLSKERAFAVDTEQHRLCSFVGFTALKQVSTKVVFAGVYKLV